MTRLMLLSDNQYQIVRSVRQDNHRFLLGRMAVSRTYTLSEIGEYMLFIGIYICFKGFALY